VLTAPLVLVVDDEKSCLDILVKLLENHGFDVATASTAAEGLQKARLLLPTAILMDVVMPTQTGPDALRLLKADPRTQGIPIVMMTGHIVNTADPEFKGAAGFLAKPITPSRLISTIDRVLGRSHDVA
jgi:CheY-like chemotaxis protein